MVPQNLVLARHGVSAERSCPRSFGLTEICDAASTYWFELDKSREVQDLLLDHVLEGLTVQKDAQ
jgi:hypothetical protein